MHAIFNGKDTASTLVNVEPLTAALRGRRISNSSTGGPIAVATACGEGDFEPSQIVITIIIDCDQHMSPSEHAKIALGQIGNTKPASRSRDLVQCIVEATARMLHSISVSEMIPDLSESFESSFSRLPPNFKRTSS